MFQTNSQPYSIFIKFILRNLLFRTHFMDEKSLSPRHQILKHTILFNRLVNKIDLKIEQKRFFFISFFGHFKTRIVFHTNQFNANQTFFMFRTCSQLQKLLLKERLNSEIYSFIKFSTRFWSNQNSNLDNLNEDSSNFLMSILMKHFNIDFNKLYIDRSYFFYIQTFVI